MSIETLTKQHLTYSIAIRLSLSTGASKKSKKDQGSKDDPDTLLSISSVKAFHELCHLLWLLYVRDKLSVNSRKFLNSRTLRMRHSPVSTSQSYKMIHFSYSTLRRDGWYCDLKPGNVSQGLAPDLFVLLKKQSSVPHRWTKKLGCGLIV